MTTSEAAEVLGVTRSTVSRMARSGALTPLRKVSGGQGLYLFAPADVRALAESRAALGRSKPGPKPRRPT
jgi:excisionase family DNA binding protein